MGEVMTGLQAYKASEGTSGLLADGTLFFIDGNFSPGSSNGRDGNGILVAFAERGIALPASYWDTHRDQPVPAHGIAFGCGVGAATHA